MKMINPIAAAPKDKTRIAPLEIFRALAMFSLYSPVIALDNVSIDVLSISPAKTTIIHRSNSDQRIVSKFSKKPVRITRKANKKWTL